MVGIEDLVWSKKSEQKPELKKDMLLSFFLTIDLITTSFLLLGLNTFIFTKNYPNWIVLVLLILMVFLSLLFFVYIQVRITKYHPVEELVEKIKQNKEKNRAVKEYQRLTQ
jgi:hypothetical protein